MKQRFKNILIAVAAALFIAATSVSLAPYWGAIVGAGLTNGKDDGQPVGEATIGPTSKQENVGEYNPSHKTITLVNSPSTLEELKDAIERLNSIDSRHNSKRKEINDKAVEKFSVEQNRIADEYQKKFDSSEEKLALDKFADELKRKYGELKGSPEEIKKYQELLEKVKNKAEELNEERKVAISAVTDAIEKERIAELSKESDEYIKEKEECFTTIKNAETAIHELFHAYEHTLYPDTYACNEEKDNNYQAYHERHEGFATTMTWLYLKRLGMSYDGYSGNMLSSDYQGYFHDFISNVYEYNYKDVKPKLSSTDDMANTITAEDVYKYLEASQPNVCTPPSGDTPEGGNQVGGEGGGSSGGSGSGTDGGSGGSGSASGGGADSGGSSGSGGDTSGGGDNSDKSGSGNDGGEGRLPYSCDELAQIRTRAQMALDAYGDRGNVADGYRPNSSFLDSELMNNRIPLPDGSTVFEMTYTDKNGDRKSGLYRYDPSNGQIKPWGKKDVERYKERMGERTPWVKNVESEPPDFVAQVLERNGQVSIVFAGTATGKDWIENYEQWKGDIPPQFQMADFLTQCVQNTSKGTVTLIGHSEGGGEVQYSILRSLQRGNGSVAGVTYNSQRLSEGVLGEFDQLYIDAASDRISNFVVGNDAVSGSGWLGEDLLGEVITLGRYCLVGGEDFCAWEGGLYGTYKAHLLGTVIGMLDKIIERQCGNQGGNSGGTEDSGGTGSGDNGGAGSGNDGGGVGGDGSGADSGSGNDSSGGNDSGGADGGASGDGGTSGADGTPTEDDDPSYGLPEVTMPLPDFTLPNGDGTKPWDSIVGFAMPYDRVLFLLSGDIPAGEDFNGAWNGLVDMTKKGVNLTEFKKMLETLKKSAGGIKDKLEADKNVIGK